MIHWRMHLSYNFFFKVTTWYCHIFYMQVSCFAWITICQLCYLILFTCTINLLASWTLWGKGSAHLWSSVWRKRFKVLLWHTRTLSYKIEWFNCFCLRSCGCLNFSFSIKLKTSIRHTLRLLKQLKVHLCRLVKCHTFLSISLCSSFSIFFLFKTHKQYRYS